MQDKRVYFFGDKRAEGQSKDKELLGGKGANLAEMTNLGIPVPPGFTISTALCAEYYDNNQQFPDNFEQEVSEHLSRLEVLLDKAFGSTESPLLLSVRSGAAVSMPGMMDTILNLGLNDEVVRALASKSGNECFAWDAYRRLINMFGNVVLDVDHHHFELVLKELKKKEGVEEDMDLSADALKTLVTQYKEVVRQHCGKEFPQDPQEQLMSAILAVFRSWNNTRAIRYRKINNITGLIGTAVNVQAMVFGNFGENSGTGVCFSRDAATGEKIFYGEYLLNAQGEDVVAGIRTPQKLSVLADVMPECYKELDDIKNTLEQHYRDMQDMEFTIEEGVLYILQTRNGKRTGKAALHIAVDMVQEGMISKEEAVLRVQPEQLDQLFHPMLDPAAEKTHKPIAQGLNASPGAASGQAVFSADTAEEWAAQGKKVLLIRQETSPEDIGGMNAAEGILTATGGMTSHAAVVARGMGRPCVAGCRDIHISDSSMEVHGKQYKQGDIITIDGTSGAVYAGPVPVVQPEISGALSTFLDWVKETRKDVGRPMNVRANADTPAQAEQARKLGAEGIGLCRTEHMFFEDNRITAFRRMIIADTQAQRMEALKEILSLQQADFTGIFKAMAGFPVTIRLFDPPLHEFVPHQREQVEELSQISGVSVEQLQQKIRTLEEANPMLGHRGCRLAMTYPEVYDMQVEAIMRAACSLHKEGVTVYPEIMIPLVGTYQELKSIRERSVALADAIVKEYKVDINYKLGTMIEIPRAALTADEIAEYADFFSFGTNDLTQLCFGYSRDDINSFLPHYLEADILPQDPFVTIDQVGVGSLIKTGVQKGRSTKPDLKIGLCGEHGGDPDSVAFCYQAGLDYVSCSPFRVPIARLAVTQAVLKVS